MIEKRDKADERDEKTVKKRKLIARQSLTFRVLFFTSIWMVIAFAGIALIIFTLYRASSERAFTDLLRAHLNTVIEAVSFGDNGLLKGQPQLGNLNFSQPDSGWLWIIDPIDIEGNINGQSLYSTSLTHNILPVLPLSKIGFDQQYIRSYQIKDSVGNQILIAETEVELNGQNNIVRIRVGGNLNVLEDDIHSFIARMAVALFIAGIGILAINAVVILYGLSPLDQVRVSLEHIRKGNVDQLSDDFPKEIAPLTREVNALIDSNKRMTDRARMQVGNLAHSLKTPLAVMLNEARYLPKHHSDLIKTQLAMMQNQVQIYLDRARISAQAGSVFARTDVTVSVKRLLRVMNTLNPDIEFSIEQNAAHTWIALEIQDFEEIIGNLLENAARFASSQVVVLIEDDNENNVKSENQDNFISVTVLDNGKGLSDEEKKKALKRGNRLDESKPGSGLGLSIVSEIVQQYQGRFILSDAKIGGLAAQLQLPKRIS